MPVALERADAAHLLSGLKDCPAVGIALSGGADSTALLWLCAQFPGPAFQSFIVDHGLRAQSAAEAEAAAATSRALGIPALILRWQGEKPASGLQAAARAARYGLMAEAAKAAGIGVILTAHQSDDVAETFLMRLARGSGLDGLAAIPAETVMAGVRILRPLLAVPHESLVATLRRENISWCEDPSNHAERFERARLRRQMAELLPGLGLAPDKITLAATRLARARAALEAATDRLMAEAVEADGSIREDAFLAQPAELRLRLLSRLIPGEMAQLERLAELLAAGQGDGFTLGGRQIRRRGGRIGILPERGRANSPL